VAHDRLHLFWDLIGHMRLFRSTTRQTHRDT